MSLRRPHLERLVLRMMGERLMAPAILASFIETLHEEHAKLVAEASTASTATSRTKAMLERRIANLVDALADDTSADLREHARAYIRRLEIHPPRVEGELPNIIVEGNLAPRVAATLLPPPTSNRW